MNNDNSSAEQTKEPLSAPSAFNDRLGLVDDLRTEADLCRNETAYDIAVLLDRAADEIERFRAVANGIAEHIDGELPMRGWLRDNDKSRAALDAMVKCLMDEYIKLVKPNA